MNLKHNGYKVFATARRLDSMNELKAEGCAILELDVQDMETIQRVKEEVETTAGRLDLLINNAGVIVHTPILDLDIEKGKEILDINFWGPVRIVQAFGPLMIRTANAPDIVKDGSVVGIVNIGSASRHGVPWYTAYGGSKAALYAVSESMRHEFANLNVKVAYAQLGCVQTAMLAGKKQYPSHSSTLSGFYSNWEDIRVEARKVIAGYERRAPTAADAAARILSYHYAGAYYGEPWYAGTDSFMAEWLWGWAPRRFKDSVFVEWGRSDLVEKPRF